MRRRNTSRKSPAVRGSLTHRVSGYTLMEMIIATLLIGGLMGVAFGLMSMYSRYLSAGQTAAAEQTLIRSLLQTVEADLLRVALADSNVQIPFQTGLMESPGGMVADPLASDRFDRSEVPAVDASESEVVSSLGELLVSRVAAPPGQISLIGNDTALRLTVVDRSQQANIVQSQQSEPEQADVTTADALSSVSAERFGPVEEGRSPDVPECQTIIWQFRPYGAANGAGPGLRSGLYRVQAQTSDLSMALQQQDSIIEPAAGIDPAVSVDRTVLESLLLSTNDADPRSDAESDSSIRVRPDFERIPEVVDCRFEYFDGLTWRASWNSEELQSLPVAVRFRCLLISPEKLSQIQTLETVEEADFLDQAIESSAPSSESERDSFADTSQPSDESRRLPTRHVERVILLQPVTGAMPLPDAQNGADFDTGTQDAASQSSFGQPQIRVGGR